VSAIPTETQTSAGGIAFRQSSSGPVEIALILVGKTESRWQLPKGTVDAGETPEIAAVREVREETGISTEIIAPIETIEYWYYSKGKERVRFHKFVHFYLLRPLDVDAELKHDWEVEEARWVNIDAAIDMLAFKSERDLVVKAREMIQGLA
jgi:8-oxo-dGTP diphosphatase